MLRGAVTIPGQKIGALTQIRGGSVSSTVCTPGAMMHFIIGEDRLSLSLPAIRHPAGRTRRHGQELSRSCGVGMDEGDVGASSRPEAQAVQL